MDAIRDRALYLITLLLMVNFLYGCVAMQSFPSVARAGDTITLALGSVDGLDKTKLQLSFVPTSTGVPIDLTSNIRSVVKIYPDRASRASISDTWTSQQTIFTGHAIWMNVAIVDLPSDLPIGTGHFEIVFDDSIRVPAPNVIINADDERIQIATEIVAGSGAPNDFSYYTTNPDNPAVSNFSKIEPLPRVVLRPPFSGNYGYGGIRPAAAEYKIRLPITGDIATLADSEVNVIWDYKPGEDNKQIQVNWSRQADIITVNVLVPTELTLVEQRFRFTVLISPYLQGNIIDIGGQPELLSYRTWDLNGNEVTPELSPEVLVLN